MDGRGAPITEGAASEGSAAPWKADASAAQLLRAADGLEEIAATCAGSRRDELLAMVEAARSRARSRRAVERFASAPATLR